VILILNFDVSRVNFLKVQGGSPSHFATAEVLWLNKSWFFIVYIQEQCCRVCYTSAITLYGSEKDLFTVISKSLLVFNTQEVESFSEVLLQILPELCGCVL